MEGLYRGEIWDPAFCSSGGITADGTIHRVSGVPAKLAAAVTLKCAIAGIPLENEAEVGDFLLLHGPRALLDLQVIGLEKFEDAVVLARAARTGKIQTAVTEFAKIKAAAPAGAALSGWLKLPAVAAQLGKVLAAEPRHLSAKILLDAARGKVPAVLSMETSRQCLARESAELRPEFAEDPFADAVIRDPLKWNAALSGLKRIRPMCHPELRPMVDRMLAYGAKRKELAAKPPRKPGAASEANDRLQNEAIDLFNDYTELWNGAGAHDY